MIVMWYFFTLGSENYLLLVNLTDPISLSGGRAVSKTFESFSSSHNSSDIFTFARGSLRESDNFTILYEEASARDYSNNLWDSDVGLIIYVYNLSPPLQYKVIIIICIMYVHVHVYSVIYMYIL